MDLIYSGSASAQNVSKHNTSARSASTHRASAHNTSTRSTSARRVSAHNTPARSTSARRMPAQNKSYHHRSSSAGYVKTAYADDSASRSPRSRKIRRRKRLIRRMQILLIKTALFLVPAITCYYALPLLIRQSREITVREQPESPDTFATDNSHPGTSELSARLNSYNFSTPDVKDKLLMLAGENNKVLEILDNIDAYPERLLEMAVTTPEAIDFIREYPVEKEKEHIISIGGTYREGTIPLYIQWDKQWGYDSYGDGMIALDGCGPTCMSMVYVGLTGDTSLSPKAMADYSVENGYITEDCVTTWDLMTYGAQGLGLNSGELPLDAEIIKRELRNGHPIICSMRPGDFTTTGHFIVLTGVTEDGTITVNDPNSPMRSEQTWNLESIMPQMKNLWVFSR